MAEGKKMRLGQVARKLNVGRNTIISYLNDKGYEIDSNPNTKIDDSIYRILENAFEDSYLFLKELFLHSHHHILKHLHSRPYKLYYLFLILKYPKQNQAYLKILDYNFVLHSYLSHNSVYLQILDLIISENIVQMKKDLSE